MTGWLLLALGALVAAIDFCFGLSWSRMTADRVGLRPDGTPGSVEQINRFGRMLMMIAPLFFLLFAAMAFGILPVGVEPIQFN